MTSQLQARVVSSPVCMSALVEFVSCFVTQEVKIAKSDAALFGVAEPVVVPSDAPVARLSPEAPVLVLLAAGGAAADSSCALASAAA